MAEESGSKEFAPTERRLDEARDKGELAIGRDLLAAAAYGALLLALLAAPGALVGLASTGVVLLDQADRLILRLEVDGPGLLGGLGLAALGAIAPWFGLPMLAVLLALLAQRGLVFAGARLQPKLSRISLIEGAKRKFGPSGLFEFAKSTVKLAAISLTLGLYLSARAEAILHSMHLAPGPVAQLLGRMLVEFLALILVLQLVIGAIDLLWQRFDHRRRLRMTRKEMMDEMKQSEGDPQMKAQRRQKAMDIAGNRMLADVPTADVVIVNPTHYAVALQWNRSSGRAPICVAKGVDAMAARIREVASTAGVPLRHDPPTARALHATVEIGDEVPPELYRAVAAAIRFSEAMRRRARARRFLSGGRA